MAASTKATGRTIRSMARASTSGKTADSTMAAGKTMTWMAWAFTSILTVSLMRVNTKRTRKLAMGFTTGPTGESTKDGGTKESSMALEFIRTRPKIKLSTGCGRWVSDDPGSMSRLSIKSTTTSTNMRQNSQIQKAQNALNPMPHLRDQLILMQRLIKLKRCFSSHRLDYYFNYMTFLMKTFFQMLIFSLYNIILNLL
jgi:hypothetical protein